MTSNESTGTNGTRSAEAHPRLLREGEVSPFKILAAILLRENYTHVEVKSHKPPDRMALGGFFYRLISTEDMTYRDLRSQVLNPANCVPPEIMLSFFRITENLDDENPCFLYELVHSIIELIDTTQIIILRKRITKNSPIGKFLRLVLLSIRKMSYPQVFHVYKQVCLHIKRDIDPSASTLLKPGSSSVSKTFSRLYLQQHPPLHRGKPKRGLDIFAKMVQDRLAVGRNGVELEFYKHFAAERRLRSASTAERAQDLKAYDFEKKLRARKKIVESEKSLRLLWKPQLGSSGPATGAVATTSVKTETSTITQIAGPRQGRSSPKSKKGKPRTPRKSPGPRLSPSSPKPKPRSDVKEEFAMILEGEDGYFISEDEDESLTSGIGTRTRSQSRSTSRDDFSNFSPLPRLDENAELKSHYVEAISDSPETLLPASKRWDAIKWQSRKLIEKTIKTLSTDMNFTGTPRYSPRDLSNFIEAVRHNPSCQVLLPQLHFLEYMNCLQVKDLTRCSESLRTSFDLRIKPNTSELNKGIPYAPYNFGVFYNLMGFNKDALSFLEEAFQAGHTAYDSMCLHYCHNLWSNMHGKPYLDVITTQSNSDIEKDKAYLHSFNVVSSTFEGHSKGLSCTDVFNGLWDASTDHDFESVESLILLSVANLLTIFGWHKLVEFPCFLLLKSSDSVKWPSQHFIAALCMYAQSALVSGRLDMAHSLMSYGKNLFRLDATITGQHFGKQEAVFNAMKAFLGNKPIDDSILATLASFDKIECYYWSAYSKMIWNDWEDAGKELTRLWTSLQAKSCENNDLRLRGLILQAELHCLYGNPSGGLSHLFQALALAEFISSEFYITLCHINIACIQNHLGLASTAAKTLNLNVRSVLRSSCLYVRAKLFVVNVRVGIRLRSYTPPDPAKTRDGAELDMKDIYRKFKNLESEGPEQPLIPTSSSGKSLSTLFQRLREAKRIYRIWGNMYRLKEVYYVQSLLYDYVQKPEAAARVRAEMSRFRSFSPWSPKTCII